MFPQNKSRLISGRPTNNWFWTFCRRFKMSSRGICNTSSTNVLNTSSRCLQDVFARHLQNFFKTSSRRLQELFARRFLQVLLKKSSRHLHKDTLQLCLADVRLERQENVTMKTSSRCLQYVFTKTMFPGWVYPSISCSLQYNSLAQAFPAPLPTYVRVYIR